MLPGRTFIHPFPPNRIYFPIIQNLRSIPIAFVTCVLCGAGDDVQQRLADRAFSAIPLLEDLHELCDGIGGRPTGSPACERAIARAEAKFKAAQRTVRCAFG
jgi:hypothetical protein